MVRKVWLRKVEVKPEGGGDSRDGVARMGWQRGQHEVLATYVSSWTVSAQRKWGKRDQSSNGSCRTMVNLIYLSLSSHINPERMIPTSKVVSEDYINA